MNRKIDFNNYSIERYISDINTYSLDVVWDEILSVFNNKTNKFGIISLDNLGELYEIGLEHINKLDKKEHGKYFTPEDISILMSKWLCLLGDNTYNICDVCCGTGNLILKYLELFDYNTVRDIILNNKLYLYDIDLTALKICKSIIGIIYGKDVIDHINCISGDFLCKNIQLPPKCKVISNPPYSSVKTINTEWDVNTDPKELYSMFMEKIIKTSDYSVIISPYSFIGGEKFYYLRELLNNYNGFIVSFDNVPGNIFIGRKHGIFNSNTSNSVRASITVLKNKDNIKGFRLTPLIRFKNEERKNIINNDILYNYLSSDYQIVTKENNKYYKCFPTLESLYKKWIDKSNGKTINKLTIKKGEYTLCIPNTCRYFTVGVKRDLSRTGKYTLLFNDINKYSYVYCLINSSFCYWYWRLFDGGIAKITIVYPSGNNDIQYFNEICSDMIINEEKYLVYKKNAGKDQENIKFPDEYREKINNKFLNILNDNSDLSIIHKNSIN